MRRPVQTGQDEFLGTERGRGSRQAGRDRAGLGIGIDVEEPNVGNLLQSSEMVADDRAERFDRDAAEVPDTDHERGKQRAIAVLLGRGDAQAVHPRGLKNLLPR